MEMTQSTVMAYFIIYCDTISPQEITQQLNIDPTEVCIKGVSYLVGTFIKIR